MSSPSSINFNYRSFKPLGQQQKSRLVAGLLLAVVVALHTVLAWYLLNAPKTELKKPIVIMEVAMMPNPGAMTKQPAKEPSPAPPPLIKQPVKPRPEVKLPKPAVAKPVLIKKPAPEQKPHPAEIKEVIPEPKFEPAPAANPASPVVTPASAVASASVSSSSSATAKPASAITGQGLDGSKTVVSDVVPLLRVPPKYPVRAASRRIEGWVKVEFTIQTDGSVDDAVVIASEPEAIFDDAALAAIGQWQFKEKMVNGVAVKQRAVQKLQFKLER